MPRIRSGELRHRMQVISWTETQDTFGQEDRTDETLRSFNAKLKPIASREKIDGGQIQSVATHHLICRYNLAQRLKTVYKLKYKGRTFELIDIINVDELNKKVIALVKEEIE